MIIENKKPNIIEVWRQACSALWRALFNILIFQVIYKLAVFMIIMPTLNGVVRLFTRISGYETVLNEQMISFLTSIFGVLLLIVLFIVCVIVVYFEFAVVLIFLIEGSKNRNIAFGNGIKAAICTFPALRKMSSIGFAIYSLGLMPYLKIGIHSSLFPKFNIPSFITNEIMKYHGGWILLFLLGTLAGFVFLKLIFSLPIMVLERCSFAQSVKKSISLEHGRTIKVGLAVASVTLPIICITMVLGNDNLIVALIDLISTPLIISVILAYYLQLNPNIMEINGEDIESIEQRFATIQRTLISAFAKLCVMIKSSMAFVHQKLLPTPIKKRPYILLIFLIAPIICTLVGIGQYYYNPFSEAPCITVGHRGSADGIENSIQAVKSAAEQGADYAEIDIFLSKDDIPVVVHDSNLFRLTGKNINVYEQPASTLTSYLVEQNGLEGNIATLDEICKTAKGKIGLLIELKSHGHETGNIIDKTVEVLKTNGMENVCMFQSSNIPLLQELRKKYPDFTAGFIIIGKVGSLSPSEIRRLPCDFLGFETSAITQPLISACHRAKKPIYAWTVNNTSIITTLYQMEVDGIVSDFPRKVKSIVKE